MKLSARNRLKGKIVDIRKGVTTSHVKIDIGGQVVTAAITNESVDDLALEAGQTAYAVIKASDVMVGWISCHSPACRRHTPHRPAKLILQNLFARFRI